MTTEEKAKAYDEALERARRIKNGEGDWRYSDLTEITPALTEILPELKESEDERIRNALLRCCDDWEKGQFGCMAKEDVPVIRAYLEKQKEKSEKPIIPEQKPAWSEEDDAAHTRILGAVAKAFMGVLPTKPSEEDVHWLKTLPERFNLQPKQEWSEEDFEKFVGALVQDIVANEKDASNYGDAKKPTSFFITKYANMLKSLLPQPHKVDACGFPIRDKEETACGYLERCLAPDMRHVWYEACDEIKKAMRLNGWKPSDEQMDALKDAVKLYKETHFERFHTRIESLYNDLKKLM